MSKYTFGEQESENGTPVWKSPKYEEAKAKAIETLENALFKGILTEGDFWILKNKTKTGKIAYSGLIISHNGCLKINDVLPYDLKFKPECMSLDKEGFGGSLVYTYVNAEQGIYEVGEVSAKNCTNAYPYAMSLKRCMDRVILKNSKLAYSGIYSDSEAEEFSAPDKSEDKVEKKLNKAEEKPAPAVKTEEKPAPAVEPKAKTPAKKKNSIRAELVEFCNKYQIDITEIAKMYYLNNDAPDENFQKALDYCKLTARLNYPEEEIT